MNTKLTHIVAAFACGLLFTTLASCREAVSETPDNPTTSIIGATAQYDGVVVTPSKPFVIMSDDGIEHSFAIAQQTKVKIDGRPGRLEGVKAGDKAAVTADKHQGQIVATLIEVETTARTASGNRGNEVK